MIIGAKLGWSTNSYLLHHTIAILVTSILSMHTLLASNLLKVASWHDILYLQMLWFFQRPYKEICLLHIWVSWDDAYNGEDVKSCSWFTNPKYAFLAIYCISIPQSALMCNIDKFAFWTHLFYTCCLSQNIPTSSSSLIVSCDVLWDFLGWSSFIYHKWKLEP